ncbi:MAG: LysE family translocator [Dokdonella sp.]
MIASGQTLLLFVAACCGLLLSPGPNMALVVSHGLAYGPRGGVAVAAGIVIADLVLTVLVVVGVAAMLAALPESLDALRFAGAAYLMWLARKSLRRRDRYELPAAPPRSTRAIVQLSVFISLLNPKALLFFMVFLPQFVEPKRGQVTLQLTVLGGLLSAIAFVFHAVLGVVSARARGWAVGRGGRVKWIDHLQVFVFLGLALRLLLLESTPK